MSSINPGIAGSVSQSALQQSQVARARDRQTNAAVRQAQQAEDQFVQHLNEVEDPGETDDDRLRVRDEQREQQQRRRQQPARPSPDDQPAASDAELAEAADEGRLDLTAGDLQPSDDDLRDAGHHIDLEA